MSSISLIGIVVAVVAVVFAYHNGYASGFENGRDTGYGDGKREGSREGSMRGYAVGFDRGRRHNEHDGDDDDGGGYVPNGQMTVAIFALILIAMFVAVMTQSPKPRLPRSTQQPSIAPFSTTTPTPTSRSSRFDPDEPHID